MEFDLVVKNGLIVSNPKRSPLPGLEIGIKNGKIACLGTALTPSPTTKIIDAQGAYITPGGVDSHVHLEQPDCPGRYMGDRDKGRSSWGYHDCNRIRKPAKVAYHAFPIIDEYHGKADESSYCDFGFHMILTNPTDHIVQNELPLLVEREGITSVKLYMTYEPFKLGDRAILDIMMSARKLGITAMIHAENSDMISLITERLEQRGLTDPYYHGVARPQIAEAEATYRAISLAELLDVPILIVHVSSRIAMAHIREAQTRMLPIHGETCPHYAYLLSEGMAEPNFEGAKHVCSPPLRHDMSDLDAIWDGIANGTFSTLSSDHAPVKFDSPLGKKAGLINGKTPIFTKIPNGLPGIETRIPLMFNGAVGDNPKITLPRFVQITSTGPAMLYGLGGVKGNIAPGYDADLVIWYPTKHTFLETHLTNGHPNGHTNGVKHHHHNDGVRISVDNLHHDADYTPYEGLYVANWPRYTILRGEVVWARDEGGITGYKGQGKFLKRKAGKVLQGRYPATRPPQYMRPGERELWA